MLALALMAVLAADDSPEVSDAPYVERSVESMTRAELREEYRQIEEVRPGVGLPITMVSVGGGLAGYGALLLLIGGSGFGGFNSLFASGSVTGYLFVAMIATGLGLLAPGFWLLWTRKDERKVLGDRMDAITERLKVLDDVDESARGRRKLYPGPPPPSAEGFQL